MTHSSRPDDLAHLSVGSLVWVASAQPVLDERTEDELIRLAREGDRDVVEELAMSNLRIVIDEAIRARGLGMAQDQLVRIGVTALLDAVRLYDPQADGRFSVHVRARVRAAFQRTISIS